MTEITNLAIAGGLPQKTSATTEAECLENINDVYVTLVIQAAMQGLNMAQCINRAYETISKRTGKMVDGQFVKDQS